MNRFGMLAMLSGLALGCGGTTHTPEDAGVTDAFVPPEPDAGPADAGPPDAGPPDDDGDGIARGADCDDADPLVGESAERPCDNACGAGVETCAAGVWAACDAPTDCLCETPGMTRVAACGNCGTRSERCTDAGVWEAQSTCIDEGECAPAAVETMEDDWCAEHQRICNESCEWSEWSQVSPRGECPRNYVYCPVPRAPDNFVCDDMCVRHPAPDLC